MNQCRIIHNMINREWETNLLICAVRWCKNCSLRGLRDCKESHKDGLPTWWGDRQPNCVFTIFIIDGRFQWAEVSSTTLRLMSCHLYGLLMPELFVSANWWKVATVHLRVAEIRSRTCCSLSGGSAWCSLWHDQRTKSLAKSCSTLNSTCLLYFHSNSAGSFIQTFQFVFVLKWP